MKYVLVKIDLHEYSLSPLMSFTNPKSNNWGEVIHPQTPTHTHTHTSKSNTIYNILSKALCYELPYDDDDKT